MDLRVKVPSKLRVLSQPEESLRVLAEHAPQAEAFAERAAEKVRPVATWIYHARRRLATGAIFALTIWLFLHVMFGANGMVIYRQKRTEYLNLQKDVNDVRKENARYEEQIKSLKSDPKTIEKEAREQLHYAKPGEVIYVAPPSPPQSNPGTNAARK
jgi:cell division protein FtsB